jgi:hypothetical protein
MTDEIIVGFFTLGGTLLGFGLTKISDIIAAKRERKRYKIYCNLNYPVSK